MDHVKIQKENHLLSMHKEKTQPVYRTQAPPASYVGRQQYLRPTQRKAEAWRNLHKTLIKTMKNLTTVAKRAKHKHASMD